MTPELTERIIKLVDNDPTTSPPLLAVSAGDREWMMFMNAGDARQWAPVPDHVVEVLLIGHWSLWLDQRMSPDWREEVNELVYGHKKPLVEAMLIQVKRHMISESDQRC